MASCTDETVREWRFFERPEVGKAQAVVALHLSELLLRSFSNWLEMGVGAPPDLLLHLIIFHDAVLASVHDWLHSSEARFSLFHQRRSEESMTKGYLLDTSRAASILMRAISSLSRSSSSPDFRLCLSMRKVEILFTSLMTTEATSSVFIHHNVLDDCLCLLVKVEGKRFACKKVPDKRVEEQVTTRCPS
uniref:Uncharacterized protein n=1 Tax=Oryza punctata TaxID=4537 RepID=A0A0E0LGI4_ORYPU